jgi:hypothetical protein
MEAIGNGSQEAGPETMDLSLGYLPQQLLAKNEAEDWSGVTSTEERRRLQNRLNQRALR